MHGGDEFRFDDPRQARIHRRLELLGPGPAGLFRDACEILSGRVRLVSASHVVGHLLREVEGTILTALLPADVVIGHGAPDAHSRKIKAVLVALDLHDAEPLREAWLALTGQNGLHRIAHRSGLLAARPVDHQVGAIVERAVAVLDAVLEGFEDSYAKYHAAAEPFLRIERPTKAEVSAFYQRIPNSPVTREFFFRTLEHPGWLEPLEKRGVFSSPPAPIRDPEHETTQFPPWPEGDYLRRMAAVAAEDVARIALAVPTTENVSVLTELSRVSVALPASQAAALVRSAQRWLDAPYTGLLTHYLRELVLSLATGGQGAPAAELLGSLLELRAPANESRVSAFRLSARAELWEYQQIRRTCVGPVVAAAGALAFTRLLAVLAAAVAEFGEEAFTRGWRPSIEDDEHNFETPLSELIAGVRDAAALVVQADPGSLRTILAALDGQRSRIFARISLYLLWRFLAGNEGLAAERLEQRENFLESDLAHEYWALAAAALPGLPRSRDAVLAWIEEGPPSEGGEHEEPRVQRWQLQRLSAIKTGLPPDWEERRRSLEANHGPVSFPKFSVVIEAARETTALSVAELEAMAPSEVVRFLEGWAPTPSPFGSQRNDLANTLSTVVAKAPERFAAVSGDFRRVHPRYIWALMQGFQSALREERSFDWLPVLDLCQWVVNQPRDSVSSENDDEDDDDANGAYDWSWPRRVAMDLVGDGLEHGHLAIPLSERIRVWSVVEPVTRDPDPTVEREHQLGWDPVTLMANSVRGRAMQAVLQYAQWLRGTGANSDSGGSFSFDQAPEVRTVFDERLDPSVDPAVATRAFFGRYFPELTLLDSEWAREATGRIFRTGGPRLESAAWESYLSWRPVYRDVWPFLLLEYERAVGRVGGPPSFDWPSDPEQALAQHLGCLVYSGILSPESDAMLASFFSRASASSKAALVAWIGRSLRGEAQVSDELRVRVMAFWDWLFERSDDEQTWLAEFGWWFAVDGLDEEWRLAQLARTWAKTCSVALDHQVVATLRELASRHPRAAVARLLDMVEADREGWRIYSWRKDAEATIAEVVGTSDVEAAEAARKLAHRLVARGFPELTRLALGSGRPA